LPQVRERNPHWRGGRSVIHGYPVVRAPAHDRAAPHGCVFEHILIVEKAMGKPLRRPAEVHHVDESRTNNAPTNLVVCENSAYHKLLHQRQRAFDACGNASWRPCKFCHQYDAPDNLVVRSPHGCYHRMCENAEQQKRRRAAQERAS